MNPSVRSAFVFTGAALVLAGCKRDAAEPEELDAPFTLELPPGFPDVPVPEDNPLTEARVRLGKLLFFDERLSQGQGIACASCHFPDRAFSDTVAQSRGAGGALGLRNAQPLFNLAWHTGYFRDGGVPSLELQALAPIHDEREMNSDLIEVATALRAEEPYATLSARGFGRELDGYVITRALAAYQRTLVSGWSRYDAAMNGDASALNEQEQRGRDLFISAELGCNGCHGGFDLSDHSYRNVGYPSDLDADPGRQRITLDPSDRGKFKVPSLRNVALTAPYMHDGGLATLEDVIAHFNSGGNADPNKDPLMHPLGLSPQQQADLIAFLRALTDERTLDQVP